MEENSNTNQIINNNNTNIIKENHENMTLEKKFKLIKDNKIYIVSLSVEKKDIKEIIKIKTSQIVNKNFYLYELLIDDKYILSIFNECNHLKEGFQKLVNLFENNNANIQDINTDCSLIINLKINSIVNKQIVLIKTNVEEKIITKELIDKYLYLEQEYYYMKNKLTNENNSLKLKLEKLEQHNQNHYFNNLNFGIRKINNKLKEEKDDENHLTIKDYYSSIWCMLNLNPINYIENNSNINLNLAAIGFGNSKIIIINLTTMKIHQTLKSLDTIYSLAQFNNNPNYLFCSLRNGYIIVYKLNKSLYEEIQQLKKPKELSRGEINKVITLTNGDLASAERGAISIWKQKINKEEDKIEFEFFKEIFTQYDTCQLIEVNPQVFACAIYGPKQIKVYNNNGNNYALLGEINNAESHGENSNGMAKINDRLFCSGGKYLFLYIVSVEPVQLIQKIKVYVNSLCIKFVHVSNSGFLFISYEDKIIQFKIIKDEQNNFIELEEFSKIEDKEIGSSAIITTNDGKILYQQKGENIKFYLTKYKTS